MITSHLRCTAPTAVALSRETSVECLKQALRALKAVWVSVARLPQVAFFVLSYLCLDVSRPRATRPAKRVWSTAVPRHAKRHLKTAPVLGAVFLYLGVAQVAVYGVGYWGSQSAPYP